MTKVVVSNQRVPFRLIQMQCCQVLICWVNPRFPNYCPECGNVVYPGVKSWALEMDENAWLKTRLTIPSSV